MTSQSPDRDRSVHKEAQANHGLVPRPYQLEMLEESIQRNLIVAMDTGSGKTLIAILRIQAELERCAVDKIVWFCVPTVALAVQQYKSITEQLPAYQARVLSGNDNCDFWTPSTWKDVLEGTRIVVSTHSILLDALGHAFVQMDRLSLLVFDEAHRATKDHPANKIMQSFYHPASVTCRPSILGLTASPVINNKIESLEVLESNLNAISRSPKIYRSELIKFVHKPELVQLRYKSCDVDSISTSIWPENLDSQSAEYHTPNDTRSTFTTTSLLELGREYDAYDLNKDPWIIHMKSESDPASARILRKAIMKQETWCRKQLKNLYGRPKRIAVELGLWAADTYIHQCIEKFRSLQMQSLPIEETVEDYEKIFLQSLLDKVDNFAAANCDFKAEQSQITPKVQALINFLAKQDIMSFAGLVFVETRAEVAILSQLLMLHPLTRSFAVSTFVGESSSLNRKFALGELADVRNQKTTLDDLRFGIKNLVVTTNALEEGIDVSACNLVVCFQKPPNLKSFVQRRGRARRDISKYVIMLEETEGTTTVSKWQGLEELMRQIYENDMRELRRLEELENEEPAGTPEFEVKATGAKLTFTEAVTHLYHFCNKLPRDPYVERVPMFFYEYHSNSDDLLEISARVVLPTSVDISVREACSKTRWTTEKSARKDAAFEAYVALYHAGLVNDNLLPEEAIDLKDVAVFAAIEKRPNVAEVDQQINIWPHVAGHWQDAKELQMYAISLSCAGHRWIDVSMLMPISLPDVPKLPLYWDANHVIEVTIEQARCAPWSGNTILPKEATYVILNSIHENKMNNHQQDFVALFVPPLPCFTAEELDLWLHTNRGNTMFDSFEAKTLSKEDTIVDLNHLISRNVGLVKDITQYKAPHIFLHSRWATLEETLDSDSEPFGRYSDVPQFLLAVKRFPKRTDFLHPLADHNTEEQGSGIRDLSAGICQMDNLPWRMAMFASLAPSILHIVHRTMLVDHLCSGLLAPLSIQDRSLVTTAISAPSAREPTDYQRLEFLGDSILKLCTSMSLIAQYLIYDEGRLSGAKDHIVSNASLSSAAIKAGLAPYILTKAFTGRKWRPLYVSDLLNAQTTKETREMSTKVLADVVESLIGAAFLDGGGEVTKALECLRIFLPRVDWTYASKAHIVLNELYRKRVSEIPPVLLQVETLVGHQFACKTLLLEAITHASYRGLIKSDSYQRLEFLGDSILDIIVTLQAFRHSPPLPVHRLHLIRTALVNGHYLGYLCMRLSSAISRKETRVTGRESVETFDTEVSFALWQAMRHANRAMASDQKACLARYDETHDDIASALNEGTHYPWALLARLEPPKPFSDMVESIIAAIWIDSHGSLLACSTFLERLGLLPYLNRVLENDGLALLHPKEELGQLADQEKVDYPRGIDQDESGKKRLTCKVMIGDRDIVNVGDGLTRMEVETRAAEVACKILRKEGRRLGKGRNGLTRDEVDKGAMDVGGPHEEEEAEEEEEGEGEEDEEEGKELEIEHCGNRKRKIEKQYENEDESDEEYMTAED